MTSAGHAGVAFLGGFVASVWLELLGAAVSVLPGPHAPNPTAAAHSVLGGLGDVAVIAIILGAVAGRKAGRCPG